MEFKFIKKIAGFSLIEVMLYIAMISVFSIVLASFWGSIAEIKQRNEAMSTVNSEAAYIMNTITESIKTATAVSAPANNASGTTLTLAEKDSALNPTTFVYTTSNGALSIKEGTGTATSLVANQVKLTSLTFTNVTESGTPGAVRIQFTLIYNSSGSGSVSYSQTYYDTISIRQ